MRDLQRRLGAAGFLAPNTQPGVFCSGTRTSVQASRKCVACARRAPATNTPGKRWSRPRGRWAIALSCCAHRASAAMTSAICSPASSRLGFDAGRIDGIFGPDTHRAVCDFQRNSGLLEDGVCGIATTRLVVAVPRPAMAPGSRRCASWSRCASDDDSPSSRRRRAVRWPRRRRPPDRASTACSRRPRGAQRRPRCVAASPRRQPVRGRRLHRARGGHGTHAVGGLLRHRGLRVDRRSPLAGLLEQGLAGLSIAVGSADGMRLPILRETRMPAILCTIGPFGRWQTPLRSEVAEAVAGAVECWIRLTVDLTRHSTGRGHRFTPELFSQGGDEPVDKP